MAPHVDDVVTFAEQHRICHTRAKRFLRHGARHCVDVQLGLVVAAMGFVYDKNKDTAGDRYRYYRIKSKFFFEDPELATLVKLYFG